MARPISWVRQVSATITLSRRRTPLTVPASGIPSRKRDDWRECCTAKAGRKHRHDHLLDRVLPGTGIAFGTIGPCCPPSLVVPGAKGGVRHCSRRLCPVESDQADRL